MSKTNMKRDESIHIAIGRVFEMAAMLTENMNDATRAVRERMRDLQHSISIDEYSNACMSSIKFDELVTRDLHCQMADATKQGYLAVYSEYIEESSKYD